MQKNQVNVIRVQLAQEPFDHHIGIGALRFRYAALVPPDFADHLETVAADAFERGDDVRMCAVKIGKIKDANAAIKAFASLILPIFTAHILTSSPRSKASAATVSR